MPREILWVAFAEKPPVEVRVALLNLGWWWAVERKRWEWRSASSAEPETALQELTIRLEGLGFDLEANGEWGVEERQVEP